MHFTQEDYIKIENWLHRNSVKDTEFQEALPFTGKEIVTVVQDGHNRKVNIQEFINQLYKHGVEDFLNVTNTYRANNITLKEAIRLIPAEARKEGQVITFLNTDGNWEIYQFIGKLNQWNNPTLWNNPFDWEKLIVDSILPDEEDLTKSAPDAKGNAYLSLKDRKYEPDKYSGLGRKILRRRVVEIEDPIYGTQEKNLLLQADFVEDNTVYVVRYDFTLNGQDITLPDNSYIEYEGGSISDGNIIDRAGGLNRVVLKKNIINGKNILTQEMISKSNTIYEIRYDFDLNNQEITIPEGCELDFQGGSLNNGIIIGNSTITKKAKISCDLKGIFTEKEKIYIHFNSNIQDYTKIINNIFEHYIYSNICFDNAVYGINGAINIQGTTNYGILITNNNNYHFNGCTFKQINTNDERSILIRVRDASNIELSNLNLVGDLLLHELQGPTDEYNYGIQIANNCSNINIHDINISDFTGDCIDIVSTTEFINHNIFIKNCRFINARRGCISLEGVDTVLINDCYFEKNSNLTTSPGHFIDIEPLEGFAPDNNITISNNKFFSKVPIREGIAINNAVKDSVNNIYIDNNTFYGNPPSIGYLVFACYTDSHNVTVSNNSIRVTSDEYPLNPDLGMLISISYQKEPIKFFNNYIEGYVEGTIGLRMWNGAIAEFNNCIFKNARIYLGRRNVDITEEYNDGPSTIYLNNCKIEHYLSSTYAIGSNYMSIFYISDCSIRARSYALYNHNSLATIKNSLLYSEDNIAIYDDFSESTIYAPKEYETSSYVKLKIEQSKIKTNNKEKNAIFSIGASIEILDSSIVESVSFSCRKRNNSYYDNLTIKNSSINVTNSNFAIYLNNYTECNISDTIINASSSAVYSNLTVVDFKNCEIIAPNNSAGYSDQYNSITFNNTKLNGALIRGIGDNTEDYNNPTILRTYGVYKYNKEHRIPTWYSTDGGWRTADGLVPSVKRAGPSPRPEAGDIYIGFCYFEANLGKPIWWSGSKWVDATGAVV